jgi:hypothetical protein
MAYYENTYRLRDEAIVLYTRPGRKKVRWQARMKVPDVSGYVIKSLKTSDLNDATNQAEDLFYQLKAEQKLGLDVRVAGNLKFKEFWQRFYSVHETGLSVHRQRLHRHMANKYFIPYFGECRVAMEAAQEYLGVPLPSIKRGRGDDALARKISPELREWLGLS